MTGLKIRYKIFAARCIGCMAAAVILFSSLYGGISRAEEKSVLQAEQNGFTFFYQELDGYQGAVEIVGITIPEEETVLTIPGKLGGKTVISLNVDEYASSHPSYGLHPHVQDDHIDKLILPRTLRPLKNESGEFKMADLWISFLNLASVEVEAGSRYLKAENGILYNWDKSAMICYPSYNTLEEYKMPSSLVSSEPIRNKFVKRIVFSKNKKWRCKDHQVWDCKSLEEIYMPDHITEIGTYSFTGCSGLKKIRWSKNLKLIGQGAFQGSFAASVTKLRLPGKIRVIGPEAFRWCGLKEVILPDTVASVGYYAFGPSKGRQGPTFKKASYLLSSKNKKLKGMVYTTDKYVAVVTTVKNKKKKYYDSQTVLRLIPTAKEMRLRKGKTGQISVIPEIDDLGRSGVKKGWKLRSDILTFKSSRPKVVKVSGKGKIRGLRRGKATVTVGMKTSDRKCRVKVKVA